MNEKQFQEYCANDIARYELHHIGYAHGEDMAGVVAAQIEGSGIKEEIDYLVQAADEPVTVRGKTFQWITLDVNGSPVRVRSDYFTIVTPTEK